jgi:hypothetical protein
MVGLTEDDLERIEHFVNTPRYERDPEQLTPNGAEGDRVEEEE